MSKTTQALLAIQIALETPKAQRNEFGGFNYRSAEDILAALKPHLAEHKLLLTINDSLVQKDTRHYVKATVRVCHVDDTDDEAIEITGFAREPEHKTKSDDAMVTGGSSSYARKYALGGMFLCDDTPDPDRTHRFEKPQPQKVTPPSVEEPLSEAAMQRNYVAWVNAINRCETVAGLDQLLKDNKEQILKDLGGKDSPLVVDLRGDANKKKISLGQS